jgi:cell division protein FtsX
VKALPIKINLFNSNNQTITFMGHVSGFSDRLNSIMVPARFMDWANKNFGYAAMNGYTAVVIKTNDPSNPALTDALQKNNYRFDKEKTRFSQYREIVNKVVPTIGIFGLLMLLFGLLVFSLFIQLTISNSQQDIQLLTTLGAAPKQLERFLMKRFFPINVIIIVVSILLIAVGQFVLQNILAKQNAFISPYVSYLLPLAGLLLLAVVYFVLRKNMRTYIYQQAR